MSPGEIISIIAVSFTIVAAFIKSWQKINDNHSLVNIKLKELEMKIESNRLDSVKEQKQFESALTALIVRIEKYEESNANNHKEIMSNNAVEHKEIMNRVDAVKDVLLDKIDCLKDCIHDERTQTTIKKNKE